MIQYLIGLFIFFRDTIPISFFFNIVFLPMIFITWGFFFPFIKLFKFLDLVLLYLYVNVSINISHCNLNCCM